MSQKRGSDNSIMNTISIGTTQKISIMLNTDLKNLSLFGQHMNLKEKKVPLKHIYSNRSNLFRN